MASLHQGGTTSSGTDNTCKVSALLTFFLAISHTYIDIHPNRPTPSTSDRHHLLLPWDVQNIAKRLPSDMLGMWMSPLLSALWTSAGLIEDTAPTRCTSSLGERHACRAAADRFRLRMAGFPASKQKKQFIQFRQFIRLFTRTHHWFYHNCRVLCIYIYNIIIIFHYPSLSYGMTPHFSLATSNNEPWGPAHGRAWW